MGKKELNSIETAQHVLQVEADALIAAKSQINENFSNAVDCIYDALKNGGKIVISGVGKSGNVARKVVATLTSTGSMAVFLHPTEALHGDLGVLAEKDILLIFSHSGSTQELLLMLPSAKNLCRKIVAVLGNPNGALAGHSDYVLSASVAMEACPHNLAPTASSTLAMAMGDALAVALQHKAGFSADHFAKFHPAGSLGKRLLMRVSDLMYEGSEMAMLAPDANIDEVVMALTQFPHSGVCIVDGKTSLGSPKLVGVVTEGDIRRALGKKEAFFKLHAKDIMTKNPSSVSAETKALDALAFMEQRERQISFLPVLDAEGGCVGALRLHDLVLAGLN